MSEHLTPTLRIDEIAGGLQAQGIAVVEEYHDDGFMYWVTGENGGRRYVFDKRDGMLVAIQERAPSPDSTDSPDREGGP
jgi:hypothetical protein